MKVSKKISQKSLPKIKEKKLLHDSIDVDVKPNVSDDTVERALEAVRKLVNDYHKRKNTLFSEDTSFLLQIECIKIPKCPKRKLRLKLPHWLVTETSDICLFVSDMRKGKKVDHEPTIYHYEDLLKDKGITNIKTVMPVRQLRVEYDQIEMRRRLLTQFDFFLADSRVSGILAHKLGSIFFKKNALPTPVKMEAADLKEEINKALHKTTIRIHGEGDTFLVKVGIGKQTTLQICENIQSVLLQLSKEFPGGWENIRSVHIKSPQSMAVPIYLTLRNKNKVNRPNIKPLHAMNEMVEGELSTLMRGNVQVYANGRVKVIRKTESDSESEDVNHSKHQNKKQKTEENPVEPEQSDSEKSDGDVSAKSEDEEEKEDDESVEEEED